MSRFFTAFCFVLFVAGVARAQWRSDSTTNTPVCTATNIQQFPRICSDGAEGAIIVWEDVRAGYRIYAQRLDASGRALWTTNGVLLCKATAQQRYPVVASDNRGGAYVVWQDARNITMGLDLYAQHIKSDGTLMYDTLGKIVAGGPNDQTNQVITADGFGNAFVAWQSMETSNKHIFLNRLMPTSVLRDSLGINASGNTNYQRNPHICEDGSGGCYTAWENSSTNPVSIYTMRTDSTGHNIWTNTVGVYQATQGASESKNIAIARDGNELMIAWQTASANSSNGQDIYANRLRSVGTLVYGNFNSAIGIAPEVIGNQVNPQIFSDDSTGTGITPRAGLLVLYETAAAIGNTTQRVVEVRILPDGNTRQPLLTGSPSTYQISSDSGEAGYQALKVGTGTLLVVWNDARGDSSIYAQRIDRDGKRYFPTFGTNYKGGEAICKRSTQSKQVTFAPRTNGGIAAWTDFRSGNSDIYAQLIFKDGSLPVELAAFRVTPRNNAVEVSWQTGCEQACAGFELQRRAIVDGTDNSYTWVADYHSAPALQGTGTSCGEHNYGYLDRDVAPGIYEYRLVEISLDGSRTAFAPRLVNTTQSVSGHWSLGTNQPNPAQNFTQLPIELASDANVAVALSDVTGRVLFSSSTVMNGGDRSIALDLTSMPAGAYFVRVIASDPVTGATLWQGTRAIAVSR